MRSRPFPDRRRARGFSLLEAGVALLVLGIMLGTLAIPLATRVQLHREAEARRQLAEASDALMGFAAANARLPCPATADSFGAERFAPGGDAGNGACAAFLAGYLPAATLGLANVDGEGFARDPWGSERNRIRYAIWDGTVNGVEHPFTRAGGMRAATLAGLGAASHYLFICSRGEAASGSGCGPAAHRLTRRAVFVLVSLGLDATRTPAAGGDAARNVDGDGVFVSHEPSGDPADPFDDLVDWMPVNLVVHRMVAAGRLP